MPIAGPAPAPGAPTAPRSRLILSSLARLRAGLSATLLLTAITACRAPSGGPLPAGAPAAHAPQHPFVRELSLNVSALEPARDFFVVTLGAVAGPASELSGPAFAAATGLPAARARRLPLDLGGERLTLLAFEPPGRPIPEGSRGNDLWFEHAALVVRDLDAAAARVKSAGARFISPAPQTIPLDNPAAGGISALYFEGPDHHPLEAIHYPPGRGPPRWQEPGAALLEGIDHTAIGVRDTGRSLAFYRDLLGLAVAGESLNQGAEQEALSGVPGARVRITGLRGEHGPGVELLEYLAPAGGRPRPEGAAVSDLLTWLITVEVSHLDELAADLARAGVRSLSPRPVTVSALLLGWDRELIVADPDGHLVRLVERAP